MQGLSIVKPPYGQIVGINLDKGELMWSTPHGDTPDAVRNHPALKGINIPKTGQQGNVGVGRDQDARRRRAIRSVTTTPEHPRGAMLRAYDKNSGAQVGAVWMPAPQSGSPMTYQRRRPPVHHRRDQRRQLLGRVHRVRAAGLRHTRDGGTRTLGARDRARAIS